MYFLYYLYICVEIRLNIFGFKFSYDKLPALGIDLIWECVVYYVARKIWIGHPYPIVL